MGAKLRKKTARKYGTTKTRKADSFKMGNTASTYSAKKSNGKGKKALKWIIAIAVILVVVGLFLYNQWENGGWKQRCTTVVSTENYSINANQFSYLFMTSYQSMASYASYFGLDTSVSLKEQDCSFAEGTWYDYFADSAKSTATELLTLCEAAKAAGIELDDEDYKTVDEAVASLDEARTEYNNTYSASYTTEQYVKAMYGSYVRVKDLKKMQEMSALASKYLESVKNAVVVDDAALETYYTENSADFDGISYLTYTFNYADLMPEEETADTEDAEAETETETAEDPEAKATAVKTIADKAAELSAITDKDAFVEYIKTYETGLGKDEATIETDIETATKTFVLAADAGDDMAWAYEDGVAAGTTKLIDNSAEDEDAETLTVVLLTATKARDEATLKNFRHVLYADVTDSDGNVTETGEAQATAAFEALTTKDEASIEALAKAESTDEGSSENGGLYEDVKRGDMNTDIDNWLFNETRTAGDCEIVESTNGWHIVYFVGDSDKIMWKETAITNKQSAANTKAIEDAKNAYAVTVNDKGVEMVG